LIEFLINPSNSKRVIKLRVYMNSHAIIPTREAGIELLKAFLP